MISAAILLNSLLEKSGTGPGNVTPSLYHRSMTQRSLLENDSVLGLVVDGVRSTSRLGNIAQGAVMSALLQVGKNVLVPLSDDQRYDLVIEDANRFLRIQRKYGRLTRGTVFFRT